MTRVNLAKRNGLPRYESTVGVPVLSGAMMLRGQRRGSTDGSRESSELCGASALIFRAASLFTQIFAWSPFRRGFGARFFCCEAGFCWPSLHWPNLSGCLETSLPPALRIGAIIFGFSIPRVLISPYLLFSAPGGIEEGLPGAKRHKFCSALSSSGKSDLPAI